VVWVWGGGGACGGACVSVSHVCKRVVFVRAAGGGRGNGW